MQTIIAPVVSNLLYFAVFGLSLRKAIPSIEGVSYLAFLAPGLIVLGMVNNAFQNPSSSIIIMKFQGLIDDLMTIPLKRIELLIAFVGSAVLRAMLIGFMTYLTAIYFVDFSYASISIIILSTILISFFFSFLGLFVGIWANEFERIDFLQNFVMLPLIFLGGVFYPISDLPPLFLKISMFNPVVHMINLVRYGFTGISEVSLITSFAVLGSFTLVMGLATYIALRKGWKLQT